MAVACRDDADWQALCRAIGRDDLAARADLAALAGRLAAVDELEAAVTEWTREHDQWTGAELLIEAGVPASPVERLADFFERDAGMHDAYTRVDSPEVSSMRVQNEPILWDGERLEIRRAPLWGEHTQQILRTLLNHGDERVAELAAANALF